MSYQGSIINPFHQIACHFQAAGLNQPYHRDAEPAVDPPEVDDETYEANCEAEVRKNHHLGALEAIDNLVGHLDEKGSWDETITGLMLLRDALEREWEGETKND